MTGWALFAAVFLACSVEAVEALTIVLAAGTASREWRSALQGTVVAVAVLAAIIAILGPALTVLPLQALRLVVGGLLLVFGLQWLRKAILRAGGYKALHDETAIFQTALAAARTAPTRQVAAVPNLYAFTLSFKGVLLEGLEVAFIAVTFGTNDHNLPVAGIAAASAVIIVATAGLVLRAPLARAPENTMKFAVGILLTGFGTFWGAEGAGASWPHGEAALPVLVGVIAIVAAGLAALLRKAQPRPAATALAKP